MPNDKIECSFSLLDSGRKYSGQHRKYLIENAREICYSPAVRERIKMREALGYYGHGRRVLCGRMDIQEVDVVTLPDGSQAMVSNVPSNVTVQFDISKDGLVSHTQEILNTETGKIVAALHASRVGGFSWACPGEDGRSARATKLSGFSGFDYVLAPGFTANRGYILESASGGDSILESVAAVLGDQKKAASLVAGWQLSELQRIPGLEDQIFESEGKLFAIQEKLADAVSKQAQTEEQLAALRDNFRGVLEGIADTLPFFLPEPVMRQMCAGDFRDARAVFESAAHIDFSQYPLGRRESHMPTRDVVPVRGEPAEYGTAEYGFGLNL